MKKSKSLLLLIIFGVFASVGILNAKVTLLPDYIIANPFKDRVNERMSKRYQTLCENYGGVTQAYAQSNGLTCNKVFTPAPNLVCYGDCGCATSYRYSSNNCRADEGRTLAGSTCNGLYNQCNCSTSYYPYTENDSRCSSKKFIGVCKGSNGTRYRACDDPCEGLMEADCVVDGVDLGCAATYGNGCDLCKSCNNNTCDLPENINKPMVATECNGCAKLVPGCSSKCESGCVKCESNCAGYRYDSPSAIPYVNETYECVMCGGSTKYKAKSCLDGYKVDDNTGGCVPMSCDEHLRASGYAVVGSASQFRTAVSSGKSIVMQRDLMLNYTGEVKSSIYDYRRVKELGFSQCEDTTAKLTLGTVYLGKSGVITEIYPEFSASYIKIVNNVRLLGGMSETSVIEMESGSTLSLVGVKNYAVNGQILGSGTIVVGAASTLNISNAYEMIPNLKLQIGGCVIQDNFEVCGSYSEADISFLSSPSYLPSRCLTSGWTNGKTTCKGNIYTNCSVGSTPVDMRYDSDRASICMITANTRVATPTLVSGGTENYAMLSSIPEANRSIYCTRCEAMDGCASLATTCYRQAEAKFAPCFETNQNPSYCMGTVVKREKDSCDASYRACRGEDSCAVQWAAGKSGVAVVKNAEDLNAAVAQSNIATVVVEGDIELNSALNIPEGKTLLGAAGSTVGCACEAGKGDCATGKYRLLVNSDATSDSEGVKKFTITGGATVKEIGIETRYGSDINANIAAVYVNHTSDVIFDDVYIEGKEGFGIKDISNGASSILLRGVTVVNGATAIKGRDISAVNTGTKLTIDTDAEVVVTGYDKGIDGIEYLKMMQGSGMFSKLRVNAGSLGISLYNTDGTSMKNSYVDLSITGGKAMLFKELSGVNPIWPYNTRIRMDGNSWGIFSEGNRTLTITGDADIKSIATASSSKAIESQGSLTISNQGYTGEGVVRAEIFAANPLIDVKNNFEAKSYVMLSNDSANSTGIKAAQVTFGTPFCYKPMGSLECAGFFSKSADIKAETAIEVSEGTASVVGLLTFKSGADVSIMARDIPYSKGIVLNKNTKMLAESGSAVNIDTVKGVVSADVSAISDIDGSFNITSKESSFSGGVQNVKGVVTTLSPVIFVDGSKAVFETDAFLGVYTSENIAADTSQLIMPEQSLLAVYFENEEDHEEDPANRNTLFANGLYNLSGTQLLSYSNHDRMLYSITTNCTTDSCSMSTFKLEDYIDALGAGTGTETDSKGHSITKLTTCSNLFSSSSCDLSTGSSSISCPYDNAKMKCYGVINSNRSLSEISGDMLPLSYFDN